MGTRGGRDGWVGVEQTPKVTGLTVQSDDWNLSERVREDDAVVKSRGRPLQNLGRKGSHKTVERGADGSR